MKYIKETNEQDEPVYEKVNIDMTTLAEENDPQDMKNFDEVLSDLMIECFIPSQVSSNMEAF